VSSVANTELAGPETKRHVCTQITDSVAALSANTSIGKEVVEVLFTTCQLYKSKNQNGTTEQLCSSSLPWRVKPHSYENTCVDKPSCRIYVTDALSPTKQLPHINTFSWVHVVAR